MTGLRKLNATAMPRSLVQYASETSKSGSFSVSVERVGDVESIIESHGGPGIVRGHRANSVQVVEELTTSENADWVRLKLAVDKGRLREPFSIGRVAALLGCDPKSAERALGELRIKQRVMLTDNRRGHVLVRRHA